MKITFTKDNDGTITAAVAELNSSFTLHKGTHDYKNWKPVIGDLRKSFPRTKDLNLQLAVSEMIFMQDNQPDKYRAMLTHRFAGAYMHLSSGEMNISKEVYEAWKEKGVKVFSKANREKYIVSAPHPEVAFITIPE
jgi:hypothetical protein